MVSPAQPSSVSAAHELALVALLDELAERLRAGEVPDWDAIRAQHPLQYTEIKRLLPVAEAMASLGEDGRKQAESEATVPAHRLGDFQLVREIGRGGMGIVYEARQISLGRRTALKVLPLASVLDPRQLQRFQNEARAAATLSHPHIVPVYSVGCEDGVHFIAMQLIEGRSLSEIIAALREEDIAPSPSSPSASSSSTGWNSATLPLAGLSTNSLHDHRGYARSVAQLGIQVAEALEHAHHVGVVHRDIKPSNLLVDQQGQVWVADFGLAMLPGDTQLTMTGDLVGTLRYMSPEQVRGERGATDYRTDIYSLGITLYELLTLQPAFPATDRQALLRQVASDEPALPRRVRRGIPLDLETIIRKAIHREPTQRYHSARELADDLYRFLEQRPIKARPPSVADSVTKWVRRRPALAALALVTLLATATLVVGQWRYSSWLKEALQTAESRERALRRQVYPSDIRDAFIAVTVDDGPAAKEILDRYRPAADRPDEEDLRGPEWHYLQRRAQTILPTHEFFGHKHAVHIATLSPDGKQLATGDASGNIFLRDFPSGKLVHRFEAHAGEIRGLAYSPDGMKLYSSGMGKLFRGWEVGSWKQLFSRYAHDGTSTSLAINRAGDRIATTGRDGLIRMWDPDQEAPLWTVKSKNVAYDAEFAEDDQLLVSVHKNYEVRYIDVATGETKQLLQPGPVGKNIQKVQTLRDGQSVVIAGNRQHVLIMSTKTGEVTQQLEFSRELPYSLAASASGTWFACAGQRGTIDLWRTEQGLRDEHQYFSFVGHSNHVSHIVFTPDDKFLISTGDDGRVLLWDLTQLPIPRQRFVAAPWSDVLDLRRSPDNRYLSSLTVDGHIRIFNAQTLESLHELGDSRYIARGCVFSANSELVAAIDRAGKIQIWRTSDGGLVQTLQSPTQGAEDVREGLALSASGEEVFVTGVTKGDASYLLRLFRDGQKPESIADLANEDVEQLVQTPDYRYLLFGNYKPKFPIVDTTTDQMQSLPKSIRFTDRLVFSSDGRYLASGASNGQFILIHDWPARKMHKTIPLPAAEVVLRGLAFSPDGKRFAASATDGYVRLYDVDTMREMMRFGSVLWKPGAICFDGTGQQLIAAVTPINPTDPSGIIMWPLGTPLTQGDE